jgi:hypothetical protein
VVAISDQVRILRTHLLSLLVFTIGISVTLWQTLIITVFKSLGRSTADAQVLSGTTSLTSLKPFRCYITISSRIFRMFKSELANEVPIQRLTNNYKNSI